MSEQCLCIRFVEGNCEKTECTHAQFHDQRLDGHSCIGRFWDCARTEYVATCLYFTEDMKKRMQVM